MAQVAVPKVGGRWASGLPYLDAAVKRADAGAVGLWLKLRQLNVAALKVTYSKKPRKPTW